MTELLSILYKLRIFTLDELSEALKGKVKSVEALLARYKQQGWIVAIRRNTYCMKDIASGLPVCDKYEIGSHLSHTACISYHTALEFHGLAHQPFNEVFVKSMTRFNPFSFDDVDYTYCRQTKEIVGMMTPKGNPYVRVTDVESTLWIALTVSTELGVLRNCCIAWRVSSCSMRKGSSIISQGTTRHSCTRRQAICWSESRNKPTSQNPSWSCAEPREPKASSG